jgi:hypothetical protein
LAFTLLERKPSDPIAAAAAFQEALQIAPTPSPPPALTITQLAEDVLARPELVGRSVLPLSIRDRLTRLLELAEELAQPSIYQRATREERRRRVVNDRLSALSRFQTKNTVEVQTCSIILATGLVKFIDGRVGHLHPGEVATVEKLLAAGEDGMTSAALAERRNITLEAATKSLMRLREGISGSLRVRRDGARRVYFLC